MTKATKKAKGKRLVHSRRSAKATSTPPPSAKTCGGKKKVKRALSDEFVRAFCSLNGCW